MPFAYSDTSVSETYESATTSPPACSALWKRRSWRRSGPSAMNARSAL